MSGASLGWTPVTDGVPQGSVFGSVLFIICIKDVGVGLENLISKSYNAKINNSVLPDQDTQSLQEHVHKISRWSAGWELPFKAHESKVIQVGLRKNTFDYEMRGVSLTSFQCVKDLAVKIASNLKSSQHSLDAASNASSEPRLTGETFHSGMKV